MGRPLASFPLVRTTDTDEAQAVLSRELSDLRFKSVTVRLFRLEGLEATEENYGQQAAYRGNIPEHMEEFALTAEHRFQADEKVPVSGNMARLLSKSRFSAFFEVFGDNSVHLGAFDDKNGQLDFAEEQAEQVSGGCC